MICHGLHIAESTTSFGHSAVQDRKLLLTKKELRKIDRIIDKGLTLVPVKVYCARSGYIKMVVALCKGKKNWDKRETIKKRDLERELKD
jgi:SsrA-binding protein